jgi:hypothetical protein
MISHPERLTMYTRRRRKFAWLPLVGSVLGGVVLGCLLAAWMVSP